MQCKACGGDMLLVKVEPDDTMIVSGCERLTLQCLGCGEVAQRTTLTRPPEARDAAALMAASEDKAAASAWLRAVKRLRRRHAGTEPEPPAAEIDKVTAFYRDWENLIAGRAPPAALHPPPKPKRPGEIRAALRAPAAAADDTAWGRALARLRKRQERA